MVKGKETRGDIEPLCPNHFSRFDMYRDWCFSQYCIVYYKTHIHNKVEPPKPKAKGSTTGDPVVHITFHWYLFVTYTSIKDLC